jgi:hypothetical protein
VSGVLSGLGWGIQEFGAPEVPDLLPLTVEYVQHRPLVTSAVSRK